MREVFRGWRRKAGVVTLLMALALMGGWIRSFTIRDVIAIPVLGRLHGFGSAAGKILWTRNQESGYTYRHLAWRSDTGVRNIRYERDLLTGYAVPIWEFTGCAFSSRAWSLPYYLITIPLTVLSAFLILWKPRKQAE